MTWLYGEPFGAYPSGVPSCGPTSHLSRERLEHLVFGREQLGGLALSRAPEDQLLALHEDHRTLRQRAGLGLLVLRARLGIEGDQRIHHHRVDGRALTGIEQRVVAGEHAGPALAREEAGVHVRGQEHQPQVVLSAPAGVATPSHPVDLMLDLQIGHAGSDAPGGGALLARRRVGIRIVDRVAGAVRVVGDLVGARPETVGVLRQHREHVVASARVVRDVCEQLLYQLLVRGGAGAGGSVEVIAARRPEELHPRATVIVLGDARTNGRPPRDDVFAAITARAGRTFWLNPEPRLYWNYGDSVISAYEKHCIAFECWRTDQLEDFVKVLSRDRNAAGAV